jgi:uncharacterized protein YdeI (YjbR/CyaY-like superfamily)
LAAITTTFYAKDRAAWRAWLRKHATSSSGIWLFFHKKASGKPCVTYDESVKEALCYGWIDSIVMAVDVSRYAQKFTPRKPKSRWSQSNIERMRTLIAAGRVTRAGMKAFEGYKHRTPAPLPTRLPTNLAIRFRKAVKACKNFERFPVGYRRMTIGWVASAKKQETKVKRLEKLILTCARNERIAFV